MLRNDYQYAMEFYTEKGDPLGQVALNVDFDPAAEWTRLAAMRKGRVSPAEYDGDISILPRWHSKRSEPYLDGFQVRLKTERKVDFSIDFASAYFKDLAAQAAAVFVEQGKLKTGDRFIYFVSAFPRREEAPVDSSGGITVENTAPPPPFTERNLSNLERSSALQGEADSETYPIFVPRQILDEAAALTRQADRVETGGILIGYLHHDPSVPEIFAQVGALIPAQHARAELTRLTFTAETWTAVRKAIELRGRKEIMLGWFHSHPVRHWECKNCSPERQQVCDLSRNFSALTIERFTTLIFSRAWSIAIVANDVACGDMTFSVFGWNRGKVEPRPYYLLGD